MPPPPPPQQPQPDPKVQIEGAKLQQSAQQFQVETQTDTQKFMLDKQFQAMQGPWYIRVLQVALAADPDIRKETWNGYSYQILLTPEAMSIFMP